MYVILSYTYSQDDLDNNEPIRVEVVHVCLWGYKEYLDRILSNIVTELSNKNPDIEYEIYNPPSSGVFINHKVEIDNDTVYAKGITNYNEYFFVIEKKLEIDYGDICEYPDCL